MKMKRIRGTVLCILNDAAYVELAIRQSVPLATLDQALAKVARRVKLPDLVV